MDGDGTLEQVIRQYAPSVYRLAYARTGSRCDAEDVMQEVFLRLVKAAPVFREEEHRKAWLLRVTVNCANDLFRSLRSRRTEPLAERLSAPPAPEPGGVLEQVLSLPFKYRVPIHLFYYEDMSVAEIAAATGRSESAVKQQLSRGRTMLREALKGDTPHVQSGI